MHSTSFAAGLGILGQRITFTEGQVTLVGDLDPEINFVASTQGSDITVNVTVRGRVSDLQITFSSQPELPQDEVMARLIFNRSISELSPHSRSHGLLRPRPNLPVVRIPHCWTVCARTPGSMIWMS